MFSTNQYLHLCTALTTFLICGSQSALAESIATPVAVHEVIVTATRLPENIEDTLASVSVITRDELLNNQSTDVAELLRMHAGIELGRTGGIGQPTSIFIRGANSTHTLILLDGVRINPGTFGTASLQNIPPETIERIEIVKGPRSTLYGTDAIGGVINIITRRQNDTGVNADARVGYGSFDTRQASGAFSVRGDIFNAGANIASIESEGFPTRTTSQIDSPYDNLATHAQVGADFGRATANMRFYQAEGTANYLGFTGPLDQDFLDRVVRADFGLQATSGWETRLVLSRMDNAIDQNQSTDFLDTERDTFDWQNNIRLGEYDRLVVGAMVADETAQARSFGTFYTLDTDIANLYVQNQFSQEAHALLLAAGYTDYSTFGAHTTWNAEYGYIVNDNVRAVASIGTAFRAPSATDLLGFGGNPNLAPEQSQNAELSLRYRLDRHSFAVTAFQNDIDDLIAYDNAAAQVRNIAKARIRGYELSYAYAGADWRAHAEAIYQDPRDRNTDQLLLRRAKLSVTAGYTQTFGDLDVGLDLLYSGTRYDFGFPNNVELDDYLLANMHARYAITDHFSMLVQIENLTNTQYELASGFNTADRSGSIALRWALH